MGSSQVREDTSFSHSRGGSRLLAVVGTVFHSRPQSCREYAERFAKLTDELKDRLFLVMRVYFEKPRTTVGWKGLIMDPKLNGTCDIPEGLRLPAISWESFGYGNSHRH
jgi:phospho-2-dehydro-3-deoxyheptonate aldolase